MLGDAGLLGGYGIDLCSLPWTTSAPVLYS